MAAFAIVIIVVVVGILGGLTGVGGVLMIPALSEILGMSPHVATGTALCSFIFSGIYSSWLYYRRGKLDVSMAFFLVLGGFLCTYLGAMLKVHTSGATITLVLAGMVIVAGANALRPPKPGFFDIGSASLKNRRIFLFILGSVVGIMGGLSGAGGAVLTVPIMIFCGFPAVGSVSASLLYAVPVGISGSVANAVNGYIDYHALAWITPALIVGIHAGTALSGRVQADQLRKIVAVLCLVTGFFLIYRVYFMTH